MTMLSPRPPFVGKVTQEFFAWRPLLLGGLGAHDFLFYGFAVFRAASVGWKSKCIQLSYGESMKISQADKSAEKETGRLEAFSDGVFAIAMTLLVLELRVPHLAAGGGAVTGRALAAALAKEWPGYFAFVSSFFTILVMWVHHHNLFRLVRRADARLLFVNGLLLLLVTAVPFPTAVIAEYLLTPAAKVACAVYGGVFVLIAFAFQLVLRSASRPGIVSPDAPEQILRRFRQSYKLGPIFYLISTLAALINSWLSMAIFTALWIFWALNASFE
ncbi:MAG: hypothetical protein JWP03_1792 [Phycisphaerales bacterium]|nr:hypothetical protein [Phycisphaerales bacterium]